MSNDPDAPRRAKLFWNGRSQAVRLPLEFRFEGSEVLVSREGDRVVLEPVSRRRWPRGHWKRFEELTTGLDFPAVESMPAALDAPSLDPE